MSTQSGFHPFRSPQARDAYLAHYDRRAGEWPVPAESRLIDTSDGQTHVRISGPSHGQPLLLLPGINASSLMWLPNIVQLSEHYRVIAVDNIFDVGRSVWQREMRSGEDFAKWLDELFNALGLEDNIILAGISYGGWIASQYALRHPSRLRMLVLLAPVFTVLPVSVGFICRAILCLIPHPYFTRGLMYWLSADAIARGGETRRLVDSMVADGYLGLRSFKRHQTVSPTVLTDAELRSIAMPTLYLVGENERLYSAAKAVARLNKVAPQIKTVIVNNAGHDLTIVQTDLVDRTILAFLDAPH